MPAILAAAIQLAAHERNVLDQVWPRIARLIREAAGAGANLIVLPEGTLPSYVVGYAAIERSEIQGALEQCKALAAELKVVLVVGAARLQSGSAYNSALVFDTTGEIAGSADKYFLWHFDRQWFAAGEKLEPITTTLGNLGVLICADGRIPTIAATLVDRGAQALVMPTAWVTSGRDPQNLENIQADLLARVRARENGVPFIAANKCGVELHSVAYCGKSQIIAADGAILTLASQAREEIITGPIELAPSSGPMRNTHATEIGAKRNQMLRIALSVRRTPPDEALLKILEADAYLSPAVLEDHVSSVPRTALVKDRELYNPRTLAESRLQGCDMAIWIAPPDDGWQVQFARARAVELRIYVVVLDERAGRAYTVDPDGAIVCGTFADFEIASFTYDPARTAQTLVAPATDVTEGLTRAHAASH